MITCFSLLKVSFFPTFARFTYCKKVKLFHSYKRCQYNLYVFEKDLFTLSFLRYFPSKFEQARIVTEQKQSIFFKSEITVLLTINQYYLHILIRNENKNNSVYKNND